VTFDMEIGKLEALNGFFDLARIGLMMFAKDGTVVLLNPRMAEMLTPLAGDAAMSDAYRALAPLSPDLTARLMSFDHLSGRVIDRERFEVGQGQHKAAVSLSVHRRPGGINMAVLEDVSEQARQESALRASDQLLRLTLSVAGIVSFRRDIQAGTIATGSDARAMFGFGEDSPPVPERDWRSLLVPEDLERVIQATTAAYANQDPQLRIGYRYVHPTDGRVRHVETRSQITYNADGAPVSSVGVAIDVTEQREADAKIVHLAHHDALTDLPNRVLFRIRMEEAFARRRRGEPFALLSLDLDQFKAVNDTLGHAAGDDLLRQAAQRMLAEVRETDTLARRGGDEFAIILSGVGRSSEIAGLAERLLATMAAPFDLDGHSVQIGVSIGIVSAGDNTEDAEVLFRLADVALYRAKQEGRGRMKFFETDMEIRLKARRTLELELQNALAGEEFEIHYQPVVRASDGKVVSLEALLRWRHPERGLLTPIDFIPIAEEGGLIIPIGGWVLQRACLEAAQWPSDINVAVNVSPKQLGQKKFFADVVHALSASGLDAARLELEITETAILEDTGAITDLLHRLKALGLAISLDDFGTGYSSLSHLQRFPFNKLKIDQSFVKWLGKGTASEAIVAAVLSLGTALGMGTVAEGVETAVQYRVLENSGCDQIQGFLISPPLPAADVLPFLKCHRVKPFLQASVAREEVRLN
jgi:diguanylate cyclase (GGDEF)-like protein/PAS domain S-box-containing protein